MSEEHVFVGGFDAQTPRTNHPTHASVKLKPEIQRICTTKIHSLRHMQQNRPPKPRIKNVSSVGFVAVIIIIIIVVVVVVVVAVCLY
jgi:hypothetical protein